MHESHIQAVTVCAKKDNIQMKIRSGGHDYEGLSYVATVPFFVLDMFNLRSIDVDVASETAWLASVITSVEVAMKSMRQDIFWAIRGGGAASFGVVLGYKVKLVRVPEKVRVFRVEKTLGEDATDIVDLWQHVEDKLPEDLFVRLVLDVVNSSRNTGEKTLSSICPILDQHSHRDRNRNFVGSNFFIIGFPEEEIRLCEETNSTGWVAEIRSAATPFPHRAGNLWKIQYVTNWNEPGTEAADHYISLTRKLHGYMTRFASRNPREAFLNYRDIDLGVNHNRRQSYMEGRVYEINPLNTQ
ncbi:FAD-binding Berberine family protein, putative [Theobroma cacao]|uniref:FAD-binding Berberine family protein, putative n=1 Tax=Theobroma cacao TaxID=3641 RepID=A0A061G767_THECC|nr:FAD-binding Berberine family protein, putative [Theobroma cacao]